MTKVVNKQAKFQDRFTSRSRLAKSDPQAFEALRSKDIEELINSASKEQQHRLRCLQWRIDKVREKTKTPMGACIAISEMMWDSFYELHKLIGKMDQPSTSNGKFVSKSLTSATILPFPENS